MNEIQCTWITYTNWNKEIRYYVDFVEDSNGIATISYPKLSSKEIEEIKNTTVDRVQKLLSKYF